MKANLYKGDCIEEMKQISDESVDAIVTDPPYGLGFMSKKWDALPPGKEVFEQCLRVLKPGGHLLVLGGTRTYHRMAVAIEDAGFDIRDMLEWVYASGFPKSQNVGKAYDKKMGNEREDLGLSPNRRVGHEKGNNWKQTSPNSTQYRETKGNSKFEGMGTNLKPAHEPICMARKPLSEKTIVDNCIKHGTGAIDVDSCRIPTKDSWSRKEQYTNAAKGYQRPNKSSFTHKTEAESHEQGRYPPNLLVTDDALNDGKVTKSNIRESKDKDIKQNIWSLGRTGTTPRGVADSGLKSRFFDLDVWAEKYGLIQTPKASKKERNAGCEGLELKRHSDRKKDDGVGGDNPRNRTNTPKQNFHPTVKPLHLMAWLVRLVSKKDDTVLDPFMGSGTTGIACIEFNRNFIGIELDKDYFEIAKKRIEEKRKDLRLKI